MATEDTEIWGLFLAAKKPALSEAERGTKEISTMKGMKGTKYPAIPPIHVAWDEA